jgi:hypothetical protein
MEWVVESEIGYLYSWPGRAEERSGGGGGDGVLGKARACGGGRRGRMEAHPLGMSHSPPLPPLYYYPHLHSLPEENLNRQFHIGTFTLQFLC